MSLNHKRPASMTMSERAWEQKLSMQLEKTNALLKGLLRLEFEMLDRPMGDKIRMLSSIGMSPSEIADVLGTTSNSVSVTLFKLRKKKKGVTQDVKETTTPAV
jgi:DNA-directed RNA polymerase specialized sigma24 family protein